MKRLVVVEKKCVLSLTPPFCFSYYWITASRILQLTELNRSPNGEHKNKIRSIHKSIASQYGFKLDALRNL